MLCVGIRCISVIQKSIIKGEKNEKKTIGFDKRILFYICAVMVILQVLVMGVSYGISDKVVGDEQREKIVAEMQIYVNGLDSWIKDKENGLYLVGQAVADYGLDRNETMKALNDRKSLDSSIMENYVCFPNDDVIFPSGIDVPEGLIVTERDWYKAAVAADGKMICTDPYIDANTGSLVVTVAKIIKKGSEIFCVVGADVTIDELVAKCSEFKIYDNSYTFLVSTAGDFIVHENTDFLPNAADGEAKFVNVADVPQYSGKNITADSVVKIKDYNNKTVMVCTSPLSNGWQFGYSIDYREYSRSLRMLRTVYIAIFVPAILAVLFGGWFVLKKCLKPVKSIHKAIISMENGDLSYAPDYFGDDILGTLCEALAKTNTALKGYVNDISVNLENMANGNFNVRFSADYVGDFSSIKGSIEGIASSMQSVIEGVSTASSQVTIGADSVSETATSLATGASEQSQTVDELNEIIEHFMMLVSQSVDNADKAKEDSNQTGECIENSNASMKELLNSMEQITEMSTQIEKIVKTIDDIAFQTNILALNAAVEAARAGAAGKGFAVVADEVRNLASKSAEAAKGTTALIQNTTEAVAKGSAIANATAESLDAVTTKSRDVNDLVESISNACDEQRAQISVITDKLGAISDIARKNAATAEESAASSEELSGQARTLDDLMAQFRN